MGVADRRAAYFSGVTTSEGPEGEIETATEADRDVVLEPDSDDGDVSASLTMGSRAPKNNDGSVPLA